jgi:hypothetical protein
MELKHNTACYHQQQEVEESFDNSEGLSGLAYKEAVLKAYQFFVAKAHCKKEEIDALLEEGEAALELFNIFCDNRWPEQSNVDCPVLLSLFRRLSGDYRMKFITKTANVQFVS